MITYQFPPAARRERKMIIAGRVITACALILIAMAAITYLSH